MICTYEEYLKQPKAMAFETMQTIHAEMLVEIDVDKDALELYSFFGEVVWVPQTSVSIANGFDENCILCHGLEDLSLLKDSIPDTRRVIEWKEYH